MRVVTVLGTRPEIIRLSRLIPLLDDACDHVLVDTGQNFDPALSENFFAELGLREPDRRLNVCGKGFAERVAKIITRVGEVLAAEQPDALLVLGDTDSGMSAYVAKRLGICVYHMEAGNRCYDERVPEELNRRVIDHSSDVLLPYTERSRENLLREGIDSARVVVTGNPINEVMSHHAAEIGVAKSLEHLDIEDGGYVLLTLHRQETVDFEGRLRAALSGAKAAARDLGLPLVCSLHPRTRSRLEECGMDLSDSAIRGDGTYGFFDFVRLEQGARCVLTDSGTVQEECCIMGVPTVTVRDSTERPETVDCGSNVVSGLQPSSIRRCVREAVERGPGAWDPPAEYLFSDVSDRVRDLILTGSGPRPGH